MNRRAYGLLPILVLMGCATSPNPDDSLPGPTVYDVNIEENGIDDSILEAQSEALKKLRSRKTQSVEPNSQIEHTYTMNTRVNHPKVKKWIHYYSVKDRERFQRFLNRGAKYKQLVQDLLVTNGLPPDLYYLGILESGYVQKAVSHAGAVGPWQFMAPTGRQYGLRIDSYVDERIDPIRSTLAAIRYLRELHRIKKSWPLAMAAYNAGPGRVRRAMRRGGSQNYWNLTSRRLLPYDTREYIPQFLAILSIGQNLKKYGFVEQAEETLPPMELVKVPSPVNLEKIAEIGSLQADELKKMNPHLLKSLTPPGKEHYHIWVHDGHVARVKMSYEAIAQHRIQGLKATRFIASQNTRIHRVRRGQHLSMIARRYGTSIQKIKRLNNLRSNRIYAGQKLRVKGRATRSFAKKKLPVATKTYYVVRRGDNLTAIAEKHGTSVTKLKRTNGLKKSIIYKGQKLRLNSSANSVKRYKIRPGDNLHKIAKKFGITVKRIKSLNNLRSNRILRGQYLVIAGND